MDQSVRWLEKDGGYVMKLSEQIMKMIGQIIVWWEINVLAKDGYLDKQAAILDSPSPSIKNWWKLLKNISGIPSTKSVVRR
jgi:hypothetical protein